MLKLIPPTVVVPFGVPRVEACAIVALLALLLVRQASPDLNGDLRLRRTRERQSALSPRIVP